MKPTKKALALALGYVQHGELFHAFEDRTSPEALRVSSLCLTIADDLVVECGDYTTFRRATREAKDAIFRGRLPAPYYQEVPHEAEG